MSELKEKAIEYIEEEIKKAEPVLGIDKKSLDSQPVLQLIYYNQIGRTGYLTKIHSQLIANQYTTFFFRRFNPEKLRKELTEKMQQQQVPDITPTRVEFMNEGRQIAARELYDLLFL